MNKTAAILSILAVVILSGGLLYVFLTEDIDDRNATSPSPSATTVITPSPTPTVPADWESYTSEDYSFTISHPSEITVEERGGQEGIRFFVLGPTQSLGTEMYDGISLSIRTDSYTENSFELFVQNTYSEIRDAETTNEITDLEKQSFNGLDSYHFIASGLGSFHHRYIDLGENRYAFVWYLVEDPENQGFKETVDIMLSSLVFN